MSTLNLQTRCAVCPAIFSETGQTCGTCHGIKYCSTKCMSENANEHKELCKAYVDLPPRPTRDHRLHLLFPALEDKPRFIWLANASNMESRFEAAGAVVAPQQKILENMWWNTDESTYTKNYRQVAAYVTAEFHYCLPESQRNKSLGLFTILGKPTKSIKGNVLVSATDGAEFGEDIGPGDVLPSDLHKLIVFIEERERSI